MTIQKRNIQNELILLQCQSGNEEGFKNLMVWWEKPLFYYIRRMVNVEEDAWDILQEVWLHAIKGIIKVRSPQGLSAWLYKVAHNRTVSFLQKASKFQPELFSEADSEIIIEDNKDCVSFSQYDAVLIHIALRKLSFAHREVLTLHFLESFSLNEIAYVTGNPVGTVKSRLYYAKKALKDILEKEVQKNERQ